MDLWFSETYESDLRMSWRVKEVLYHEKSKYQDILILDTYYHGRMLVLDGCVMTTERDEFVYHELITHPALLAIPKPKAVCIIGGGDGGTVREVLKHDSVERVVLAEIDGDVVDVCKTYFPHHTSGLSDPRVDIQIGDGFDYLKNHRGEFDAILSDSTDPVGPGEILFNPDYFRLVKSALKPEGCFVTQSETMWARKKTIPKTTEHLNKLFGQVFWFGGPVPTYPNGFWSFLIASDLPDPRKVADPARQSAISKSTLYYTPELHSGLFFSPKFLDLKREF